MGINSLTYVKANVSINLNGEAKVGFSVGGKHYNLDLPDFDTDFHEFDYTHSDGDGDHFDGVLDGDRIAGLYEWDFFPPELVNITTKLS